MGWEVSCPAYSMGLIMRNLVLILIAFIAVVTFIRAFDNPGTRRIEGISEQLTEFNSDR
jgi:hypothetical protein